MKNRDEPRVPSDHLPTEALDPALSETRHSDDFDRSARPREAEPLPESIGQYRVLSKLGEGGMGVVFEAEQQNPRRRVAVKVVRGGTFLHRAESAKVTTRGDVRVFYGLNLGVRASRPLR